MTKIILCDDNSHELKNISAQVAAFYGDDACEINCFDNPMEALAYCDSEQVDIAILDIVMPEMTGIELAQILRSRGLDGHLVFLTTSNEFASEAFEVEATSYLLKPVNESKLAAVLKKIEKARQQYDHEKFTIFSRSAVRLIPVRELMYTEIIRHKLYFYLADGEVVELYATMREYAEQLLQFECIVQCHTSFLVNMNFIKSVESTRLLMKNDTAIPISRSFTDTRDICLKWLFGRRRGK